MARATSAKRHAFTYIEALVALVILAVGIMGVMGAYSLCYQLTLRAGDSTVSYNLARDAVENARAEGFYNAPAGTTTAYFDANGAPTAPANAKFSVATDITTDMSEFSVASVRPAHDATRTVTVTVTALDDGAIVEKDATYLVYGGV